MPKSIQDILDHADQLSEQFENLDTRVAKDVPLEVYLLQRAVVARARSEQHLIEAVAGSRAAGMSWRSIAAILGTSAQAAQQRFAAHAAR